MCKLIRFTRLFFDLLEDCSGWSETSHLEVKTHPAGAAKERVTLSHGYGPLQTGHRLLKPEIGRYSNKMGTIGGVVIRNLVVRAGVVSDHAEKPE